MNVRSRGSGAGFGRRVARGVLAVVAATFALAAFAPSAHATIFVYTLSTTGGNWSSGNWSSNNPSSTAPVTPGPDDSAVVRIYNATDPHVPITTTMDIPNLVIDRLSLQGLDITVNSSGGLVLGLKGVGNFTNNANVQVGFTGNVLALPIAVTGNVTVASGDGFLTISGSIEGPSTAQVTFIGQPDGGTIITGRITRPGDTGSDPGIKVAVATGILALSNSGTNQAIKGQEVAVGLGGSGATPILRLDEFNQIADTTNVSVNAGVGGGSSTFNLNGRFDAVNNLVVGGAVTGVTSSGRLEVKGTLAMSGGTMSGPGDPALLQLDGDATATSAADGTAATISGKVALKGARTLTVNDGLAEKDLVISNGIVDSVTTPGALTKAGSGTLALTPSGSNSYTGGTTIADGTLFPMSGGRAIPGGTVTVGDGTGAPSSATLRFGTGFDIDETADVVVRSDGLLDLNGWTEKVDSLTVQDGWVDVPTFVNFTLKGGQLDMTGGTIRGEGKVLTRNVSATSSAQGPARIESRVTPLPGSDDDLTFDVAPGAAPELEGPGALDAEGTGGFVKTGTGTMLFSGANTLAGATDVQAGTLAMNGTQTTPVSVGANGTLTGNGTVGATTVAGKLTPTTPALHTGDLTFGPASLLTIAGPAAAELPRVDVTGTTTVQAGAQLAPTLTGNPPAGTALPLIVNDAADPISGQFANAAEGATFTGDSNQPFTFGYATGDGNDLSLTAGAVPTGPSDPGPPDPGPPDPGPTDKIKPKLTFTAKKKQELSRKNTVAVKLTCDEDCTVTLLTSVKPPGKKSKTGKATRTIRLTAAKSRTVKLKVPKIALSAVKKALKARKSVLLKLSATAADAAGNKSAAVKRNVALRR